MYSVKREMEKPYLVASVLAHHEIFDCITEDGIEELPQLTGDDLDKDCYLLMKVKGSIAGVYILQAVNGVELDIHANFLPTFRKEHARPLTKMMYEWVRENTGYEKLTAQVPVIYPNVMGFCELFGMQREGVNRKSWRKRGELHDQVRYGITAGEIDEFLEAA